jgi:integrase
MSWACWYRLCMGPDPLGDLGERRPTPSRAREQFRTDGTEAGRLSGIDVARIVKKLRGACQSRSGQLRRTLTPCRPCHVSAAIAGASERSIMNQTGHKSVQMVRRYIREGSLFRENSAGKLGL